MNRQQTYQTKNQQSFTRNYANQHFVTTRVRGFNGYITTIKPHYGPPVL